MSINRNINSNTRKKCLSCGEKENHVQKTIHRCRGCVCNQLRKLPVQTEVDLFLLGGQIIEDVVFINFDQKDCCAFFTDPTTEPGSTIIVDCQDIQAIRIESD
ncbi:MULTISPECIES: hydrolase [Lysinibacillus]|uniref:hydrolase n=1 Tax=Lysinibacillus TaxID=400634 RepID=UPI001CBEBA59|nr:MULTISPECIES: hydrolase [Lysinibacillus]